MVVLCWFSGSTTATSPLLLKMFLHINNIVFFFLLQFPSDSVVLKCLIYHLTEVPVDTEEHNLLIIMDKLGARQLQSVILLYDGSSVLGVILAGLNI